MVTFTLDTKKFDQTLKEYVNTVDKETKVVLRDEMRLFVQRIIELTPPFTGRGSGKAAQKQGEDAVERDINKVFYTGKTLVDYITNDKLKSKARKYVAEGNLKGLMALFKIVSKFLTNCTIENTVRPSYHQSLRNRRGGITNRSQPIFITNAKSVLSYIKEIQKHVGRAKAGWNSAAEKFKVTRVPAWVRRHGSNNGSSFEIFNQRGGYLEATNNFKSINVLDADKPIVQAALRTRERDIRDKIRRAIEFPARKFNK